jgi:hypothetical protein
MAYVPQRTTYKLVFEDPEYDGLEVSAYAGSIGQYMEIAKLADLDLTPPFSEDVLEPIYALFEAFASVLVKWNIEQPKGKKVPATVQGLKSLEITLAMAIIHAWMNAVVGTAVPLEPTDLELPVEPLAS